MVVEAEPHMFYINVGISEKSSVRALDTAPFVYETTSRMSSISGTCAHKYKVKPSLAESSLAKHTLGCGKFLFLGQVTSLKELACCSNLIPPRSFSLQCFAQSLSICETFTLCVSGLFHYWKLRSQARYNMLKHRPTSWTDR